MKFEIINPSDAYLMEADDLEVAAVAVCFLGAGQYALKGIEESHGQDVPIFLFNGHDEWFTEKFGKNFEDTSTHIVDNRSAELAAAFDSVKIKNPPRSSTNNIKATAQALSNAVRTRKPAKEGESA